jgi:hypothetical protein
MPSKALLLLPGLILAGLIVLISGCGTNSAAVGGPNPPATKPEKVDIEIDMHGPHGTKKPVVTVTNAATVKQLFDTISGLPLMPKDIACTMELGPEYNLTFYADGKTLPVVNAQRYGCRQVTIHGEKQERTASAPEFWNELDLAILKGTPAARVQQLAVLHTLQNNKPGQSELITSAETAQKLYDAILKLPLVPANQNTCSTSYAFMEYQMAFLAAHQTITAIPDLHCHQIQLGTPTDFKSRNGLFQMDSQFEHLLRATFDQGTFATVHPDQLTIAVQDYKGTSSQTLVTDTALMQKLFEKVWTLPSAKQSENCPSENDKIAQKGQFYQLKFSQWNLPILDASAFKGDCTSTWSTSTMYFFQGDTTFWDLVQKAA